MTQLQNECVLLNARFDVGAQQLLKEGTILGKTANSGEFVLEKAPNVVRLQSILLFTCQENLAAQDIIVLFRILVERAHLDALDKAILFVVWILENFKQALTLIVVSLGLVGKLNEDVNMGRCSCMHMMQASLGHVRKNFVKLRLHQSVLHLKEVVKRNIVQRSDQVIFQQSEFLVGCLLLICCLRLDIV